MMATTPPVPRGSPSSSSPSSARKLTSLNNSHDSANRSHHDNNHNIEMIRSTNWQGSIPVIVTLASTSLSSPQIPPPIHVLVHRNTFLHIGLQNVVERLHRYAPTVMLASASNAQRWSEPEPGISFDQDKTNSGDSKNGDNDDIVRQSSSSSLFGNNNSSSGGYPVCWFEDEDTQMALRWHLFVGVLYDMKKPVSEYSSSSACPIPWRIKLHFTQYPSSQILPLQSGQVLTQVQQYYKNSLKQALCIQSNVGSTSSETAASNGPTGASSGNKVAMSVTRESHERLWESICHSNYSLFEQVHTNNPSMQLQYSTGQSASTVSQISMIPVRLYVNTRPPIQRLCRPTMFVPSANSKTTQNKTLGQLLVDWLPEYFYREEMLRDGGIESNGTEHLDETAADSKLAGTDAQSVNAGDAGSQDGLAAQPELCYYPKPAVLVWRVAGIQPSLDTHIIDLWLQLSHPDHFLYVTVTTTH